MGCNSNDAIFLCSQTYQLGSVCHVGGRKDLPTNNNMYIAATAKNHAKMVQQLLAAHLSGCDTVECVFNVWNSSSQCFQMLPHLTSLVIQRHRWMDNIL